MLNSLRRLLIERTLGISSLRAIIQEDNRLNGPAWLEYVLQALNVNTVLVSDYRKLIPRQGRCIFVSNHPTGILDGIVLYSLISPYRQDIRMIVNKALIDVFPKTAETSYGVAAPSESLRYVMGVMQMHRHLQKGKSILIFPAGRVGIYNSNFGWRQEAAWNPKLEQIVSKFPSTVIPIYIDASTSLLFQLTRFCFSPAAKLLLFREVLYQRGKIFKVCFGRPIAPHEIVQHTKEGDLAMFLREKTLQEGT